MTERPQDTSAEEPDGGNPHIRFRGGPGSGNRPGLLNKRTPYPSDGRAPGPQLLSIDSPVVHSPGSGPDRTGGT
jgi:hypothetical protein